MLTNFCPKNITGKIINSETKEKVPYVSIGIENKATGTVSNYAGEFSLKIGENISPSNSVTFSSIGFKTVKFAFANLSVVDNVINLVPMVYELEGITFTNRTTKNVILGRNQKGYQVIMYFAGIKRWVSGRKITMPLVCFLKPLPLLIFPII